MVLAVCVGILAAAPSGSALSCTLSSCPGPRGLVAIFGGTVSPEKLPKNDYTPVTASIFGKIKTTDDTHPSALRETVIDIDKDIRVNVKGLPVCRRGSRDVRVSIGSLERLCRSSIIGRGEAWFEIAFPEQEPIKIESPLLALNGGEENGEVTLEIIFFVTVPAPTETVITVKIRRKGSGIHAIAKVPIIAGGSGSLLGIDFKLGKTYEYKGRKLGLLEAKCPDGVFKVSVPSLLFKSETHEPGVAATTRFRGGWTMPCTPVG